MITATVSHDQISRLMLERVHIEVPSADTDLMELGLLDSLTLVELMTSLEEEFGIHISFDEIELDNFRSVARIAEFVNQQSSLSEPAAIY